MRNGQRIIEFSYDGLEYSLLLNGYDRSGLAKAVFMDLAKTKKMELVANVWSSPKLAISYKGQQFLELDHINGEPAFTETPVNITGEDQGFFNAFESIMGREDISWPSSTSGGGEFEDFTWRVIGVTAGGTQSLGQARCEEVFKEEGNSSCRGTVDCYCTMGRFLCVCVCGELCDY